MTFLHTGMMTGNLILVWIYQFSISCETSLPMLGNKFGEYPKPDTDESLHVALLHKSETKQSALPRAPPPPISVHFCLPLCQVRHLNVLLIMCFADHLNIFYIKAEIGNDECTEMQLKIQDSAKSLCVCNYTQSVWDLHQFHRSKPCVNNSGVLCIE
jgi:hypothetical protein